MVGAKPERKSLYKQVDTMTSRELDALPQGVIQLDPEGRILQYNLYEENLANMKREHTVGRNFFKEVAPCTDVQDFQGRFEAGVAARKLNHAFRYHFSFPKNPTDVEVEMHYSPTTDTVWVFISKVE
jgi:photoactive yellow protein